MRVRSRSRDSRLGTRLGSAGPFIPAAILARFALLGHGHTNISRATFQSTDVVLPAQDGREVRLRCVVRPDAAQAALLDRLGLDLPERFRLPPRLTQTASV